MVKLQSYMGVQKCMYTGTFTCMNLGLYSQTILKNILCLPPNFYKFESNETSYWLNHAVQQIRGYASKYKIIWKTKLRPFFRMDGEYRLRSRSSLIEKGRCSHN